MSELLEYAEKAGIENIRFHLSNAETLARDASATLTILLAGIGGATAYAVKGLEQAPVSVLTVGVIGLDIWLMVVAAILVCKCILSMNLPAPTNEPLHLFQEAHSLDSIRRVELRNTNDRIKLAITRNHRVAAWLDRVRLLSIASPTAFGAATLLAWVVR